MDEKIRNQFLKNRKLEVDIEKGEEEIRNIRKKNELKEGNLISVEICKHLFPSYIESISLHLLKLPKKLGVRIDNHVNNKQADKIIEMFVNEISTILIEGKKDQTKNKNEKKITETG